MFTLDVIYEKMRLRVICALLCLTTFCLVSIWLGGISSMLCVRNREFGRHLAASPTSTIPDNVTKCLRQILETLNVKE